MSQALVQVYLFFGGRCEEALEFYRQAVGAQVEMLMRYSDSPEPIPPGRLPPGFENKVMHASVRIGQSLLMASDGCEVEAPFRSFSLSLTLPTKAEAEAAFAALADGGQIVQPIGATFFSPCFGMLADRFGVDWMVTVAT